MLSEGYPLMLAIMKLLVANETPEGKLPEGKPEELIALLKVYLDQYPNE
jgi:hypothetical protein